MTQADSVLSTPPTNTPANLRRRFDICMRERRSRGQIRRERQALSRLEKGSGHSSRFSFRFPQCVSLRSVLYTRSTFTLRARNTHANAHASKVRILRGHQ
jgi:hypothetical protein